MTMQAFKAERFSCKGRTTFVYAVPCPLCGGGGRHPDETRETWCGAMSMPCGACHGEGGTMEVEVSVDHLVRDAAGEDAGWLTDGEVSAASLARVDYDPDGDGDATEWWLAFGVFIKAKRNLRDVADEKHLKGGAEALAAEAEWHSDSMGER